MQLQKLKVNIVADNGQLEEYSPFYRDGNKADCYVALQEGHGKVRSCSCRVRRFMADIRFSQTFEIYVDDEAEDDHWYNALLCKVYINDVPCACFLTSGNWSYLNGVNGPTGISQPFRFNTRFPLVRKSRLFQVFFSLRLTWTPF